MYLSVASCYYYGLFFFFNDTATTEIYTLSLHDALPILGARRGSGPRPLRRRHLGRPRSRRGGHPGCGGPGRRGRCATPPPRQAARARHAGAPHGRRTTPPRRVGHHRGDAPRRAVARRARGGAMTPALGVALPSAGLADRPADLLVLL